MTKLGAAFGGVTFFRGDILGKNELEKDERVAEVINAEDHSYQKEGYFFIADEESGRLLILIFGNKTVKKIGGYTMAEKKTEEDNLEDIYRDGIAEGMMDNNELTPFEEAFIRGYNSYMDYSDDVNEV